MSKFAITNAKVILPDKIISRGTVVVKGKKIVAVGKAKKLPSGIKKINARGNFVAPGFIDLHIHGDIARISRQQLSGGTTGFLATLHPAKPKQLLKNIALAREQSGQVTGAGVLGLRLEGPFINRKYCGALSAETLRNPDLSEARRIIKQTGPALKMVVLAPELKNALGLIRILRKNRIICSLGHTGATYQEMLAGINAGATHVTHVFNRIRDFDHRDPGALTAALTDRRLNCEVIGDGVHVNPATLKLLHLCKGSDKIILITDSTRAQAHPPKKRCGVIFRLSNGTLYGTALKLNQAVKNAVKFLGLSIPEAVKLATLNPAKLLKMDSKKGSIAVGKDADIAILDKNFKVKMTMVEGKIAYKCAG